MISFGGGEISNRRLNVREIEKSKIIFLWKYLAIIGHRYGVDNPFFLKVMFFSSCCFESKSKACLEKSRMYIEICFSAKNHASQKNRNK